MHFILIRESNELAAILFCREREEEPVEPHVVKDQSNKHVTTENLTHVQTTTYLDAFRIVLLHIFSRFMTSYTLRRNGSI